MLDARQLAMEERAKARKEEDKADVQTLEMDRDQRIEARKGKTDESLAGRWDGNGSSPNAKKQKVAENDSNDDEGSDVEMRKENEKSRLVPADDVEIDVEAEAALGADDSDDDDQDQDMEPAEATKEDTPVKVFDGGWGGLACLLLFAFSLSGFLWLVPYFPMLEVHPHELTTLSLLPLPFFRHAVH
jgi:hypothetical protein